VLEALSRGLTQKMLHGAMAELRRSAEADLANWKPSCSACCCPRTPTTRNAFLEIRAGTGGDESALFAGDLAAHVHPLLPNARAGAPRS
jgi:peptide chain release factor 1